MAQKTSEGMETGAWELDSTQKIMYSLDPYATVFQAELRAIRECADWINTTGIERCLTTIYSDSKVALQALDAIIIIPKAVMDCRGSLKTLSKKNGVRLMWVLGHSGILRNEKADRLAGRSAQGVRVKTCEVETPVSQLNRAIKHWLKWDANRKWRAHFIFASVWDRFR